MPFLSIHGVNVRDEKAILHEATYLANHLARHVVRPLARDKIGRFDEIEIDPEPLIFPVYWGDVGVKFAWGLRSLPRGGISRVFAEMDPEPQQAGMEILPASREAGRFEVIRDRVREFFARLWDAPVRVASVTALSLRRETWNDELARFGGDVLHYLRHRGDREHPGEIIRRVLAEIDRATAARPGEPLFVVTHSMGGNIFLDVLTHFRPDLEVEVWISVGGQIGMFEEMKLFCESDPNVRHPMKVRLKGDRVKCWLNVYDSADPFSYLAGHVFSSVTADVCYNSGAGGTSAHTAYFRRRSFYDTIRESLREIYQK